MCGQWAYKSYLKYAAVFPEIVELPKAAGVKAKVKDNRDKTALLVKVVLPDRTTAVLNDGEHDNWSIQFNDGKIVELDIPVEKRDAKAIAAAVLKIAGK